MTIFLRLLADKNKASNLPASCEALRAGERDGRVFQVAPESFRAIPGAPFAYWVSEVVRQVFRNMPAFEGTQREARQGLATADDFRFVRAWWEVQERVGWMAFAKGGSYSPYYADIYLTVNWSNGGAVLNAFSGSVIRNPNYYLRPGLTWPLRTNGLSFRVFPQGCIFGHKGPTAVVADDGLNALLALLALVNSHAFGLLVSVQLARAELAQSFEVGLIQKTPVPDIDHEQQTALATLARRAWSLKRRLDTSEETSHAFALPAAMRSRLGDYDPPAIESELARIQAEIDAITFELYEFSPADLAAAQSGDGQSQQESEDHDADEDDDEKADANPIELEPGLLSWAVGVAFGRFDWRLATGERKAPSEPEPFDPLPALSPGMLPEGAEPFHAHAGILVDDPGHPHDLAQLTEAVLERVDSPVSLDVRRWLQRDFFAYHLQRYSKSRRKAPIYWPLSTTSGSYTLWLYYPTLTSQTLFTAVNDFVEPKLKQVGEEIDQLQGKGSARSKQDEKQLETLTELARELADLKDTLEDIAPGYKPNQDDGVQITAAPLWPLFRHTPWQKLLKDTWNKLEHGDYDWAHLALNYWPERVLRKCHQDRSLAIAHNVEEAFWHEVEVPVIHRGRETGETKLEWQPRTFSDAELDALIQKIIKEKKL